MSSFVTLTGFDKKILSEIIDEIATQQRDEIDSNLNTQADSLLGQINGIFADKLRELWDVADEVIKAFDPDQATGAQLDALAAISRVTRLAATSSTVTLTATGTAATFLPSGRQVRVPNGGIFQTTADATIAAATAWAPTTAYAVGDIVENDTPDRIYRCEIAGTSAGSGGPTGTGTAIVDGTVTWRFLGAGDGFVNVAAESVDTGPIVGLSHTITEIVTAVSGFDGVTNILDAALGRNIETDAALRIRREETLQVTGKATLEAIRAALLNTTGVSQAFLFENTGLTPDINLVPGKAFEAIVLGGSDADIAQTIFDTKPAGIQAYGTDISESIVDSQGNSHTIEASRPTPIEMFVDVTVVTDGNFPLDGVTQIEQALADLGDALNIGDDVIYVKFQCAPLDIAGVIDVTVFEIARRPTVVTSGNAETYALVDGQTLTVKVDGQSTAQTATFNTADFVSIGAATAAEVAAVITTDIVGATGADAAGFVTITSDSGGTIEVTGGTANGALGFPTTFAPGPGDVVNVAIASRELAIFDSSRIVVTVT